MSLKNLLALQTNKTTSNKGIVDAAPVADAESVRTTENSESQARGNPSAAGTGEVSSASEAAAPAKRAGGLRLNTLGTLRQPSVGSNPGTPQDVRPAAGSAPTVPGNHEGSADEPSFELADIAGFDETVAPATRSTEGSGFLDEIEATAPDRDLPEGLQSQQLLFVESLDNIYQVLNDPELFAQSVRMIMLELQENPEYIRLISDQDVHTMIRAMRNTMGLARIKKTEKTRKAKSTTAAKKRGAIDADAMALLDALGGDDD